MSGLEGDGASRTARIQAGIREPAIDASRKPHGFAIRCYPQSFEFSTLGGWIATRYGGHFATHYTHIDDFVESPRRNHAGGDDRANHLGAGQRAVRAESERLLNL
jgi:FAD/FMN-containing dehydrogenase